MSNTESQDFEQLEGAAAELASEFATGGASSYSNDQVVAALTRLQKQPDYSALAEFLNSLRQGFLVADVTGTTTKKKGTRVRTLKATNGKLVLPLFTSLAELKLATAKAGKKDPEGAVMPAKQALELINTGPFAAVEFNSGSIKQVLLRKFVTLVLSNAPITAESLQNQ